MPVKISIWIINSNKTNIFAKWRLSKRHKDNWFELCEILNKEFCIVQMNNLNVSINVPKRDDNGQVSTQSPKLFSRLKPNKKQILINEEIQQQILQHYLPWPRLQP